MTPLQKALQKLGANDFNFSEEDLKELRIYYDDAAFARIQQRIKERPKVFLENTDTEL